MRIRNILLIAVLLFASSASLWASDEAERIATEKGVFSGSMADAWWTVISFVLVLAVLGRVAWRPMLNGLQARQEHIAQQIASAEFARKQAEKTLADYNKQVEQLEAKGQEIIKQVTARANDEGRELAEKARKDAAGIKAKAHEDITLAHASASEQLWNEVGDIVLALGSEVLGRKLTKEDNDRLINEAIIKLKQQKQAVRS